MKTWITGDWHVGHENIIEYCQRPDNFVELIWQNHLQINQEDLLINLGDLFMGDHKEITQIIQSIKCRKYLILGNHDVRTRGFYHGLGFDFVGDCAVVNGIFFTHKPLKDIPNIYRAQVFAHCHQKQDWLKNNPSWYWQKFFCYSPELENYKPIELKILIGRMEKDYLQRINFLARKKL